MKNGVDGTALLVFFIILAMTCLIGAALNVVYDLSAVASEKQTGFAVRNLVLKLIHIPVHLFVLIIVGGFMNPFLFLASWIPALFGIGLLIFDGFTNVGACVALYLRKKCRLSAAVLLGLVSFVYIGDIIGAIVQITKAKGGGVNG